MGGDFTRIRLFLAGSLLVSLRGGDAERFFARAAQAGLPLFDPVRITGDAFRFRVAARRFAALRPIARHTGVRLHILKKEGLPFLLRPLIARPGLWGGFAGFLSLLYLLSFFLWSVEVTGVSPETARRITSFLAENGLHTGAFLPLLDAVELKSRMLISLDELDWAAVNLRGTRALVEAVESAPKPEDQSLQSAVPADLVAKKDGVILETIIYRGEQLIFSGAAVKKGDIIASHEVHGIVPGTKELSGAVRAVHAAGEVIARREGHITAYLPATRFSKVYTGQEFTQKRLFFADIPIKFSRTYGNPYSNSDIIRSRHDLTLPGGRALPLALEETRMTAYTLAPAPFPGSLAAEEMQRALEAYLLSSAEKGHIEELRCVLTQAEGLWRLDADYTMTEDIGEAVTVSP